jgi:hypothetical protein
MLGKGLARSIMGLTVICVSDKLMEAAAREENLFKHEELGTAKEQAWRIRSNAVRYLHRYGSRVTAL